MLQRFRSVMFQLLLTRFAEIDFTFTIENV
jgi:hypothetical protein